MSKSGEGAWNEYFSGSNSTFTTVKKSGDLLKKNDDEIGSRIMTLKEGIEIEVYPQSKYKQYTKGNKIFAHVKVIKNKKEDGLFLLSNIAKPIKANPSGEKVTKLNILAEDFIGKGRHVRNYELMYGPTSISYINRVDQIKNGVLAGLSKKAKKYPLIVEIFKEYFKGPNSNYTKLPKDWNEVSDSHKNELGVYFGEILFGLIALSEQYKKPGVLSDNIFGNNTIKSVIFPTDPSYPAIDSVIAAKKGKETKLFPISSKYEKGAPASFFTNLLPKGFEVKDNDTIFSKIVKSAKNAKVTKEMLLKKQGAMKILYEYGIRNILGFDSNDIADTYSVYEKLKIYQNTEDDNVKKVIGKIQDLIKDNNYKIEGSESTRTTIKQFTNQSVTSFFSRRIAYQLMNDDKSLDEMKDILTGKNFYQANLNKNEWLKGNVKFKIIKTSEVDLKITGTKSSVTALDAPQGTINYFIE